METYDFTAFSTVFQSYQDYVGDNERMCAMENCLQLKRSLPQAWLEPRTARSATYPTELSGLLRRLGRQPDHTGHIIHVLWWWQMPQLTHITDQEKNSWKLTTVSFLGQPINYSDVQGLQFKFIHWCQYILNILTPLRALRLNHLQTGTSPFCLFYLQIFSIKQSANIADPDQTAP